MARYIDADEVLKTIKKMLYETALNNFTTDRSFSNACEEIAEHRLASWIDIIPSAEVVPMDFHERCLQIEIEKRMNMGRKTVEWINDDRDGSITCSQCGCTIWNNDIIDGNAFYCPNCGAMMTRGDNNDT